MPEHLLTRMRLHLGVGGQRHEALLQQRLQDVERDEILVRADGELLVLGAERAQRRAQPSNGRLVEVAQHSGVLPPHLAIPGPRPGPALGHEMGLAEEEANALCKGV